MNQTEAFITVGILTVPWQNDPTKKRKKRGCPAEVAAEAIRTSVDLALMYTLGIMGMQGMALTDLLFSSTLALNGSSQVCKPKMTKCTYYCVITIYCTVLHTQESYPNYRRVDLRGSIYSVFCKPIGVLVCL